MTKGVQDRMNAVAKVRDDFHRAVYETRDLAAALALLADDCVLTNLPAGTGGDDAAGRRRYLAEDVLPHLPADLHFRRVSRTGDRWRVAQEDIVCFTHDRELPWLLPGVAATGRGVEVLAMSVVTVQGTSVRVHRTLWDQAALLAQLDLSPAPARR